MKCTKIDSSKDNLNVKFEITGVDDAFINTLRRTVIEEVPTLAVEDIDIKDNSSALFDEMLALRLGLIPIKTDIGSYQLPTTQAEITERSAKCTLQLSLKANKKGMVYAKAVQSKDPKCTFAYEDMPIVKLIAKQKVDCTLWAVMGQGKEHIKWSPGLIWYNQNAKITIKDNKELLEQFKHKFPELIFDKSGKISEKLIRENNLVDAVDRVCPELVDVEYQDGEYTAKLESFGQLTTKEILTEAAKIIQAKAKEMEKLL